MKQVWKDSCAFVAWYFAALFLTYFIFSDPSFLQAVLRLVLVVGIVVGFFIMVFLNLRFHMPYTGMIVAVFGTVIGCAIWDDYGYITGIMWFAFCSVVVALLWKYWDDKFWSIPLDELDDRVWIEKRLIELYVTALRRSALTLMPLSRAARGASSETGVSSGFVILSNLLKKMVLPVGVPLCLMAFAYGCYVRGTVDLVAGSIFAFTMGFVIFIVMFCCFTFLLLYICLRRLGNLMGRLFRRLSC